MENTVYLRYLKLLVLRHFSDSFFSPDLVSFYLCLLFMFKLCKHIFVLGLNRLSYQNVTVFPFFYLVIWTSDAELNHRLPLFMALQNLYVCVFNAFSFNVFVFSLLSFSLLHLHQLTILNVINLCAFACVVVSLFMIIIFCEMHKPCILKHCSQGSCESLVTTFR